MIASRKMNRKQRSQAQRLRRRRQHVAVAQHLCQTQVSNLKATSETCKLHHVVVSAVSRTPRISDTRPVMMAVDWPSFSPGVSGASAGGGGGEEGCAVTRARQPPQLSASRSGRPVAGANTHPSLRLGGDDHPAEAARARARRRSRGHRPAAVAATSATRCASDASESGEWQTHRAARAQEGAAVGRAGLDAARTSVGAAQNSDDACEAMPATSTEDAKESAGNGRGDRRHSGR